MHFSYNFLMSYLRTRESTEKVVELVSKAEYDGLEIHGEAEDTKMLQELLDSYNLKASSIVGLYFKGRRDLISSDEQIRKDAIKYVNDCSTMASDLGAGIVIVIPRSDKRSDPEKEWKWAVEGLKESGKFAEDLGVKLAIEPLNRYEIHFINRIDQGLKLMEEVCMDSVKVMGDCFQMNIEEVDIANAVRKAGKNLIHVHVADSNRQAPGKGHTDFKSIFRALKEMKYDGYIATEAFVGSLEEQLRSLSYVKGLWESV